MSVPVETVDVAVKLLLFSVPVVALYVKLAAASIATVDPELVLVKIGKYAVPLDTVVTATVDADDALPIKEPVNVVAVIYVVCRVDVLGLYENGVVVSTQTL